MAKPRVHEVASELGVDSKAVLKALREMGEFVKAPSSAINPPVARKVKARLRSTGFSPSRAHFPTLGSLQDDKLLALFHELPTSARKFVQALTVETKTRTVSQALARATTSGEVFVVQREDSPLFEAASLHPRPLAPEQLFAERGLLVLEHGDSEIGFRYHFLAWQLSAEGISLLSVWFRVINQYRKSILESTAPAAMYAEAIDGWFAPENGDEISILRAVFDLVPVRISGGESEHESVSDVPKKGESGESPFIRLYRPGSEPAERSSTEPSGAKKRPHRVRGHSKQQWYPSAGEHREIWIEPYKTGVNEDEGLERKAYLVKPKRRITQETLLRSDEPL